MKLTKERIAEITTNCDHDWRHSELAKGAHKLLEDLEAKERECEQLKATASERVEETRKTEKTLNNEFENSKSPTAQLIKAQTECEQTATQQKLVESGAMVEALRNHLKIMDDDLRDNLPEYERLEGTAELLEQSSTDALLAWFRERTELIYQRLEALSLDVESEWLKEALATLKKERGESPNGG
jgi:hypothetical protein